MIDGKDWNWDEVPSKSYPANPAAAADFTYTVPADSRALLSQFTARLVTSAVAANRTVRIKVTSAAGVTIFIHPAAADFSNQTASHTGCYHLGIGLAASDAADQLDRSGPLADDMELPAGAVITTTTTNIQAGDQWNIVWILKLVSP